MEILLVTRSSLTLNMQQLEAVITQTHIRKEIKQ